MASAAQRNIRSVSYAKYGYFFILPFFAVYCFFQLWPLINTFILSLYGDGDKFESTFLGLENFEKLLFGGDDRKSRMINESFMDSLVNTVILWFGNFIPQIALSLALAVWFTDAKLKIPGKGFFKVIMYMPNIITATSVAALFLKLFGNDQFGTINQLLEYLGLLKDDPIDGKPVWIHFTSNDSVWAPRILIMFIQTWLWFGNTMIMLMSGIMGLNPSLFEAANIDGASSGQVFRKITLPLLKPIMLYTLITSMIGGLQMFDIPYLLRSDPRDLNDHTKTLAVFIYDKLWGQSDQYYGTASAASVLLFFMTVALGSITFYMNRDKDAIARKKERKANMKKMKEKQRGLGGIEI